MCKRDKEDREKRLSCLLDVEPLSELSPDNGRPRVFKSVAAFICEQASANVATRRGLGDPTTSFFFSPLSFSSLRFVCLFYYYLEVDFVVARGNVKCRRKKWRRYKIHVVTWCGQQGTKRLTSLRGKKKSYMRYNHAMFPLLIFCLLSFFDRNPNWISFHFLKSRRLIYQI